MRDKGTDYGVILDLVAVSPPWPVTPVVIQALSDPYIIGELTMLSAPTSITNGDRQEAMDWRGMSLLMALWAESRSSTKDNSDERTLGYVREAQRYMGEHMGEPFRLRDVATKIGLSAEHLRHLFVKREGLTMGRWLTGIRIRRATDLLMHAPLPIKAIATQCGFRSESYFCTVYKKETGMTPGVCRQRRGSVHYEQYLGALRQSRVTAATYEQQANKLNR